MKNLDLRFLGLMRFDYGNVNWLYPYKCYVRNNVN
jgi:hypothetical protein